VAANAWIVVDADTGRVIAAQADHQLERPASIIKLLTALIAVENLRPNATVDAQVPSSAIEALDIGMEPGQAWALDDVLHALLMDSSNDAGYALAHTIAGSSRAFAEWMAHAVRLLRLPDHPVLHDPSGLDDSNSFEGGDYVSAYDMAIIGRDVLAVPLLRQIVGTSTYEFVGPGNAPHTLHTIDRLLSYYPGAIGLKTGYTQQAGNTMVAAATRNGRTILVVEFGAPDLYGTAGQLLDLGFATPTSAESRADQLPPPHPSALRRSREAGRTGPVRHGRS
jgi:D-alanyl-D-alanine carboxypeptidase (penicillin-binding protein 5/6)